MNCEETQELMLEYISRCLSREQNSAIIRHIAECADCRTELVELINMKRSAPKMEDVPEDITKSAFNLIGPTEKIIRHLPYVNVISKLIRICNNNTAIGGNL